MKVKTLYQCQGNDTRNVKTSISETFSTTDTGSFCFINIPKKIIRFIDRIKNDYIIMSFSTLIHYPSYYIFILLRIFEYNFNRQKVVQAFLIDNYISTTTPLKKYGPLLSDFHFQLIIQLESFIEMQKYQNNSLNFYFAPNISPFEGLLSHYIEAFDIFSAIKALGNLSDENTLLFKELLFYGVNPSRLDRKVIQWNSHPNSLIALLYTYYYSNKLEVGENKCRVSQKGLYKGKENGKKIFEYKKVDNESRPNFTGFILKHFSFVKPCKKWTIYRNCTSIEDYFFDICTIAKTRSIDLTQKNKLIDIVEANPIDASKERKHGLHKIMVSACRCLPE